MAVAMYGKFDLWVPVLKHHNRCFHHRYLGVLKPCDLQEMDLTVKPIILCNSPA